MYYSSVQELGNIFRHAINKLAITYSDVSFLNFDQSNPDLKEQELMQTVINIAEILSLDLNYLPWFHIKNELYPFENKTPYEHLVKYKRKGLLEILFYLNALVANRLLKEQYKKEDISKDVDNIFLY